MSLRNTRNHVLTAGGDNDFLLAAHNLQVAALIEMSQVTGTEPAVLSERLSVLFGVLVVAANHAHATNQKLAVLSNIASEPGMSGPIMPIWYGLMRPAAIGAQVSVRP